MKKLESTNQKSNEYIEPIYKLAYRLFENDLSLFKEKKNHHTSITENQQSLYWITTDHVRYNFLEACFVNLQLAIAKSDEELHRSDVPVKKIIKKVYDLDVIEIKLTSEEITDLQDFMDNVSKDNFFRKRPYILPMTVTINNEELNQYVETEKKKLKRYYIGRYILTDEIKAAAFTPLYIGIRSLSPVQKGQICKAFKGGRESSTLLCDYYTGFFGINEKTLDKGDIFDMTFGNKGIKRRMKPFFSLNDKDHVNDTEALTSCIRLTAYLKGIELKYARIIKQTVKKSLNCYLNEVFLDFLSGVDSHPVISQMHNQIISEMLNEVRQCCDVGFVLECHDANSRIDAAINSVFHFHTVSDKVTVFARKSMPVSVVPHIAELIKNNDAAGFGKYTVFEEFYMFLILLEKRAQLASKIDRTVFDGMIETFQDKHGRIQAVHLNRIGVTISKSYEEYADMLKSTQEPIQTYQADPVTEYTKDFFMFRAPEKTIDFGDYLSMYTEYFVQFMCDLEDHSARKKLYRKIKDNLQNVIYLIINVCGKTVNALDIFLCFYIYFTSKGIMLRQTGHHAYDTKTLLSTINKEELSSADLTALRMTLKRLRKVALIGSYSEDYAEHPAEEMIYDYFSDQLITSDLIAASENISILMKRINKC